MQNNGSPPTGRKGLIGSPLHGGMDYKRQNIGSPLKGEITYKRPKVSSPLKAGMD